MRLRSGPRGLVRSATTLHGGPAPGAPCQAAPERGPPGGRESSQKPPSCTRPIGEDEGTRRARSSPSEIGGAYPTSLGALRSRSSSATRGNPAVLLMLAAGLFLIAIPCCNHDAALWHLSSPINGQHVRPHLVKSECRARSGPRGTRGARKASSLPFILPALQPHAKFGEATEVTFRKIGRRVS